MFGFRSLMLCAVLSVGWTGRSLAQDSTGTGDLTRDQLSRVIEVLRLQPDAAGQSCLDALHEVHKTENDVKTLESRAKDPDKDLAQDVLQTDYENGNEICGADAGRVCGQAQAASASLSSALRSACIALKRPPKG